jgi:dTDP-4-amino-4,6-dideoxygalactose transaminase
MHLQPVFRKNAFISVEGNVSGEIFERGICLPSDIKMDAQTQEEVIKIIKSCF